MLRDGVREDIIGLAGERDRLAGSRERPAPPAHSATSTDIAMACLSISASRSPLRSSKAAFQLRPHAVGGIQLGIVKRFRQREMLFERNLLDHRVSPGPTFHVGGGAGRPPIRHAFSFRLNAGLEDHFAVFPLVGEHLLAKFVAAAKVKRIAERRQALSARPEAG